LRKRLFRAIFVGYSTGFSPIWSIFSQHPRCAQTPCKDIWLGFHDFWTVGYRFRAFYGPFRCLCNRELLAQTKAKMIHFVILTVPPPRTDHSIMHNTIRGRSPDQKGSRVRFRENVRFEPFSRVIAHDFHHSGQFVLQHPGSAQTSYRRHLARFPLIFGL
jgi:hypothetical protein